MAKLNYKSFWLGFALGGIGISATVIAVLVALGSYYGKGSANDLRTEFNSLSPMNFPETDLSICNAIDNGWVLRDLSGKQVILANFRGKVLFVDFWATWCQGCTVELPSIVRLQQRVRGLPIEFLFITNEDPRRVQAFLKKNDLSIPVYFAEKSPPSAFSTSTLPTTFIINKDGFVVYRHTGLGKWDDDAPEQFLGRLSQSRSQRISRN